MANGTVKWFSEPKGFGFITDEAGVDHHFGVSDVLGAALPSKGERVSFEPSKNRRGPKAREVQLLGGSASREEAASSRAPAHGKEGTARSRDDRVVCGSCSRRMVPRIITGPPLVKGYNWTPVPKRSICPFCGTTFQKFPPSLGEWLSLLFFIALFLAFLFVFFRK